VLLKIVYLLVRRVLSLAVPIAHKDLARDADPLVLPPERGGARERRPARYEAGDRRVVRPRCRGSYLQVRQLCDRRPRRGHLDRPVPGNVIMRAGHLTSVPRAAVDPHRVSREQACSGRPVWLPFRQWF